MAVGIQDAEGFMSLWHHLKIHGHLPMVMKDMAPGDDFLPKGRRCSVVIYHFHSLYRFATFCGVATWITISKILGKCLTDWKNLLWKLRRPGYRTPTGGFGKTCKTF